MEKEKTATQTCPDMSQVSFEDAVSILLGVPPEGEEIIIQEEPDEPSV